MKKRKTTIKSSKHFKPSRAITSIVDNLLHFENDTRALEGKIAAGTITDEEQIKKERDNLRKRKTKLNRDKVHVLNKHIFPGMANLTVLLESMIGNIYIAKIFREDVQALFFAKSTVNKNMKNAYVFWRFANAVCSFDINKWDSKTQKPFNRFKLILCDIMQERVNDSIFRTGLFIFDDEMYGKILGPDMQRARAWTRMLARESYEDLKFDRDRRPALF
jgi:hypothetical protein